ncbi:MAG: ATP-binding protein [Candidatus Methanogaster sp.]|uniref:ATP-binding protein n=1 Tax=Candidatus Methanogaster sp. TaxID=3386292 RepID=A0AC61L1M4_9EURY|nr:MAG: ATP-binding protein [ANME-2 cluster archaeon]
MKRIQFHNREKKIKEIRSILHAEPSLITFIYGPINSGKTTLISHLIEELPEAYTPFYINLRTKFLSSYDEFIKSLFEMEMETEGVKRKRKETLAELVSSVTKVAGIPINKEFLDYVFKDNKPKNAFAYIIKLFEEVKATGKQPVLILDELQKIGDVKVNGFLIYELFNFFIDLTKEKHLAHVFVMTSDSLFIEQIYSEAMLEDRCTYLLVDEFDEETTTAFLEEYEFSDDEMAVAWKYCGGKPISLVELVNMEGDRKGKVEEMLKIRKGQIEEIVYSLEARYTEMFDAVMRTLSEFIGKEKVGYKYISDEIKFLVGKNIIFADFVNKELRAQSRLNLLAIREVMKNV